MFGCTAYVHIKQGKLKSRALECMFFEYPKSVKGYRFYYQEDGKRKPIIVRDVTFKKWEICFAKKLASLTNNNAIGEKSIELKVVLSNLKLTK